MPTLTAACSHRFLCFYAYHCEKTQATENPTECFLCLSFSFESSNFKIQLLFPVQSLCPAVGLLTNKKNPPSPCFLSVAYSFYHRKIFLVFRLIEDIIYSVSRCATWALQIQTAFDEHDHVIRYFKMPSSANVLHMSMLIDLMGVCVFVSRLDLSVFFLGWTSAGHPRDVGTVWGVLIGYSELCMAFERHAGMRPGMYD